MSAVADPTGQLAAGDRSRRKLLVEAWPVHDAVSGEQVWMTGKLKVIAAERRALVAGHVGGRRETAGPVVPGAVKQHADERLDTREVDRAVRALVALVEGSNARAEDCRHNVTLDSC